ncbi:trypsin-like serine protease [Actinoplanes sp. NPDC051470]|uniref:S1 family peptidase n=1 Tax=Actinoplanes sp. NPDC051470 TaxID=3157224 RepID=UPI00341BD2E0
MNLLVRAAAALGASVVALTVSASPATAIIDGHEATQRYDGMVHLTVDYPDDPTVNCGAGLYDAWHVVVDAHCVSDNQVIPDPVAVDPSRIMVRAGTNDRTSGGETARGTRVQLHPDWTWGTSGPGKPVADIALVTVDHPINQPLMKLPPAAGSEPGTSLRAIGWGLTEFPPPADEPDRLPAMLRQRDIVQLPAASCATADPTIGEGDICISVGTCLGDAGGPVLTPARHRAAGTGRWWVWQALVSRATNDDDPCGAPVVATSLPYYRTWLATAASCPLDRITSTATGRAPQRPLRSNQAHGQRRVTKDELPFLGQLTGG